MAEDWAADVKKYAPKADDNVIAGIVRYCGIALTKRDSSLVAMSDKKETDRVRENFLKKKLGRTETDAALDAEIAAVGERMKADRTKNRVTVYYLLADKFDSLGMFLKASNAKAKAPAKASGAATEKKPAAKISTKTTKAPTKPKAKTTGAAVAAGGAALGLAALGSEGSGGGSAANDDGVGAKAAAALGAAGAAVTGAANAAADTAGAAASKVGDVVGDAASAAADTAGAAGAAVVGAAGAAVAGAAALASGAGSAVSGGVDRVAGAASSLVGGNDDEGGSNWLWWLLGGLLALFAIWWFFLRGPDTDGAALPTATEEAATATASTSAPSDLASAPAEGTVAIPAGAGVTSELRDGKPVVKVYFASGKTEVVPDFTASAEGLKAYLASHAGSKLAISGYADPTGNAAFNAELSKQRAQAVQAALVAAGIAETSTELVKPEAATDATVDKASARRVEVVVR